jgi:hypothetical protein
MDWALRATVKRGYAAQTSPMPPPIQIESHRMKGKSSTQSGTLSCTCHLGLKSKRFRASPTAGLALDQEHCKIIWESSSGILQQLNYICSKGGESARRGRPMLNLVWK